MAQEVIEVIEREVEVIELIERGPAGPSGPQPDINYEVVSSARTLEAADLIAADTSGGAFTLTLPLNPSDGDAVDIFDFSETFDTNNLTIARNGQPIESLNEDLVANVEGAYFTLIYTGSTRGWQVLPRYGTSGGGGESALTTEGDMLYRGPAVNTRLPIGTAGQVLKVNSGATAPEWGAAPATGVTSVGVSGSDGIEVDSGSPITGSGTIALGINAASLRSHINVADGANNYTHPNHSGEVTSSGDGATTIANDVVTNAKLANVATATIKGRATAGTGDPEDLTASQVRTILNVADGAEVNVQSNWTEADSGSDAFILNKPTLGGAAALNVGTTTGTVCAGDDARLSDSRTPTTHAASHAAGGSDPLFDQDLNTTDSVEFAGIITPSVLYPDANGTGFSIENGEFYDNGTVAAVWVGSEISIEKPLNFTGPNAATDISTTRANLGLGDAATADIGTAAGEVCAGDDSRLTDSRTPTTHAASHAPASEKAIYMGIGNAESLATSVTIRAVTAGTAGNNIELNFDGVDSINTVIGAWNAANTSNTAELVSGNGSQVPDNGEQIVLSGGTDGGSDPLPYPEILASPSGVNKFKLGLGGDSPTGRFVGVTTASDPLIGILSYTNANAYNPLDEVVSSAFGMTLGATETNLFAQYLKDGALETQYTFPATGGTLVVDGDLGTAAAADIGTGSTEVAAGDHGHGNLSSDGKLGSTSGLPVVTTTAGAVTTLALGTANQVLRVNSGASGVEFADPAASGVTGAASSASDVLGVSGANITGVDANADRIVYWNNTSNKLAYGTPADAGAAAASHTHTSADINSQTASNGHVLTANGSGGSSFAALPASGISAVGASTADVFSVSGSDLVADDGGTIDSSDPFIKWDDVAGKLVYANPLRRTSSGAFYVGLAPTTTALGNGAVNIQSIRSIAADRVASGLNTVCVGPNTRASAEGATSVGNSNSSTAFYATSIGQECAASGEDSVAIGGYLAAATANNAVAIGRQTTANLRAMFSTRAFNAVYWGGQTTNNTATILNLDATATNRFTIAANTALAVDILLVARRSDVADKWLVARRFLGIRRDGSNNTSLIGAVQTLGTDQSAGSPTWSFALTADDTNEVLQLEVTGATGETVQWRALAMIRSV